MKKYSVSVIVSILINICTIISHATMENPYYTYFFNLKEATQDSEQMRYYQAGCWNFLPVVGDWQGREKHDMAKEFQEKYSILPQDIHFPLDLIEQLPPPLIEQICTPLSAEKNALRNNEIYEEIIKKLNEHNGFLSNAYIICKTEQEELLHKLTRFRHYVKKVLGDMPLSFDLITGDETDLRADILLEQIIGQTQAIIDKQQEQSNFTEILTQVHADVNKTLNELAHQKAQCHHLEGCEAERAILAKQLREEKNEREKEQNTIALLQELCVAAEKEIEQLKKNFQPARTIMAPDQNEKYALKSSKNMFTREALATHNASTVEKKKLKHVCPLFNSLLPIVKTKICHKQHNNLQGASNDTQQITLSVGTVRVFFLYPMTMIVTWLAVASPENKALILSMVVAFAATVMISESIANILPEKSSWLSLIPISTETALSAVLATVLYPFTSRDDTSRPLSLSNLYVTLILTIPLFAINDIITQCLTHFAGRTDQERQKQQPR